MLLYIIRGGSRFTLWTLRTNVFRLGHLDQYNVRNIEGKAWDLRCSSISASTNAIFFQILAVPSNLIVEKGHKFVFSILMIDRHIVTKTSREICCLSSILIFVATSSIIDLLLFVGFLVELLRSDVRSYSLLIHCIRCIRNIRPDLLLVLLLFYSTSSCLHEVGNSRA